MSSILNVHPTFNHTAPVLSFSISTLIDTAESAKKQRAEILQRTFGEIGEFIANPDTSWSLSQFQDGYQVSTSLKEFKEAHGALLILQHLKDKHVKSLNLDTSKSLYQQILQLGTIAGNCPEGYEINAYRNDFTSGTAARSYSMTKRHPSLMGTAPKATPQ